MTQIKYHVTQSQNSTLNVGAAVGGNPTVGQAQLVISGNNNYKKLVGVMLIITDDEGNHYTKRATVSVSTTSGLLLVPEQPYACVRPSFNEKPADRILSIDEVNGNGHDFRFQVSIPNLAEEPKSFDITAICYFTNK